MKKYLGNARKLIAKLSGLLVLCLCVGILSLFLSDTAYAESKSTNKTIVLGDTATLQSQGSAPYIWRFSDENVVRLGEYKDGDVKTCIVRAVGVGTAMVTVTYKSYVTSKGTFEDVTDYWYFTVIDPEAANTGEGYGGNCGENAAWRLTSDGTLTISGSGEMDNFSGYNNSGRPGWAIYTQSGTAHYVDSVNIVIEDGITNIGNFAFSSVHTRNVKSVTLPATVTKIGTKAFIGSDLTNISFAGEGLETIGFCAFHTCKSLTSVYLPLSLTTISEAAFQYCYGLTDVYYAGSESDWEKINIGGSNSYLTKANIHYNSKNPYIVDNPKAPNTTDNPNDSDTTATYESDGLTYKITSTGTAKSVALDGVSGASNPSVTIPGTVKINGASYKVTAIAKNAFAGNKKLKTVKIGKNVTAIESKAFYKCTSLKTVKDGANLTSIGSKAFAGCAALKTFNSSSKKLKKIGSNVFSNCKKLKTIVLKSSAIKKSGVKNALKKSSVTTVKTTAALKSKYKKIFTKANIGRKVTVKKA